MATKVKRYSARKKSAALAALERNGGNVYRTAKETDIPSRTLRRWATAAQVRSEGRQQPEAAPTAIPESDTTLDERLEHLAYRLVEAMPDKLDEANLQQMVSALKFVLDKIGRAGEEKRGDVYEKLAHLIDRYAAEKAANGDSEPPDES